LLYRGLNEKIVERGLRGRSLKLQPPRRHPHLRQRRPSSPLAWNPTPAEKNFHRIDSLGPANLPLGIKANTQYDQACQTLAPGDRLFLYSDGITECPIPTGDFFDEDRLLRLLNDNKNEDLHILKQNLKQSLEDFSGGPLLHDDCTFLCFEVRN